MRDGALRTARTTAGEAEMFWGIGNRAGRHCGVRRGAPKTASELDLS